MVYKPERKQQTFERGDSGIGKVRFSTDGQKVQVKINVPAGKDKFEEKTYVLDRDACPDNILQAKNASEWMLQMSGQGDKLMSFRPVRGVIVSFRLRFGALFTLRPCIIAGAGLHLFDDVSYVAGFF